MDLWGLPLALGGAFVLVAEVVRSRPLWSHLLPADSPSHTGELVTGEEGSQPPTPTAPPLLLRTASLGTKEFMKVPPAPDEGQLLGKRADSSRHLQLAVFEKGVVCGFKEQFGQGRPATLLSLGLVAGPPQMWTVGSLVGISESVLEEQSQSKSGDTVFVVGEERRRHPHLRPQALGQVPWATQWRVLCLFPAPPSLSLFFCHLECLLCSVLFGKLHSRPFKEKNI